MTHWQLVLRHAANVWQQLISNQVYVYYGVIVSSLQKCAFVARQLKLIVADFQSSNTTG